jgi:hypothetical protein
LITKSAVAGATCAGGGTKIQVGLDNGDGGGTARNGTLEAGEVDSTAYVCGPQGTYLFRADGYMDTTGTLQRYTIFTDTWNTMASAPSGFRSSMGTDGTSLYSYHADNTLRAYNIAGNSWSVVSNTGPAATSSGFLRYTPNGVYYCPISQSTMYRYNAGTWTNFALGANCSSAGTFDPATGKLYIRVVSSHSFMVVDSVAGSFTATFSVPVSHGFETASGAYYAGNWYTQNASSPIQRVDATTGGTQTSTGLVPACAPYCGMATDFEAGKIFLAGWGDAFNNPGRSLVLYDPVAGTVTTLTSAPTGVNSEANLTVVP